MTPGELGEFIGSFVVSIIFIKLISMALKKLIPKNVLYFVSAAIFFSIEYLLSFLTKNTMYNIFSYVLSCIVSAAVLLIVDKLNKPKKPVEIENDSEDTIKFIVADHDRCVVCGELSDVNENCVCEECFRKVYK